MFLIGFCIIAKLLYETTSASSVKSGTHWVLEKYLKLATKAFDSVIFSND